jgi:hypothetical protein
MVQMMRDRKWAGRNISDKARELRETRRKDGNYKYLNQEGELPSLHTFTRIVKDYSEAGCDAFKDDLRNIVMQEAVIAADTEACKNPAMLKTLAEASKLIKKDKVHVTQNIEYSPQLKQLLVLAGEGADRAIQQFEAGGTDCVFEEDGDGRLALPCGDNTIPAQGIAVDVVPQGHDTPVPVYGEAQEVEGCPVSSPTGVLEDNIGDDSRDDLADTERPGYPDNDNGAGT